MGRWGYETIDDYADIRNQMGRSIATATNKYDLEAQNALLDAERNKQYADAISQAAEAYGKHREQLSEKAKAKALEGATLSADAVNKLRANESLGGDSETYKTERAKLEAAFAEDPNAKKPGFLKRLFRTPSEDDYKDEARQKFKALTALQSDTQEQRNNQSVVKSLAPSVGITNDWTLDNVGQGGGLAPGAHVMSPLDQGTYEKASLGEVTPETTDLMRKASEKEIYELAKQRKLIEGTEAEAAAAVNFDKHYDESMFINHDAFLKAQAVYTDSGGNASTLSTFLKRDLTPEQIMMQKLDLEDTRLSIQAHRATIAEATAAAGGMSEKELKKTVAGIDGDIEQLKKDLVLRPDTVNAAGTNQYIGILQSKRAKLLGEADLRKNGIQGAVVKDVLPDNTVIFDVKDPKTGEVATLTFNPRSRTIGEYESKRREGQPGTISGEGVEPSTGLTKVAEYLGATRATKPVEQGYSMVPDFSVLRSNPTPPPPPPVQLAGFSPEVSALITGASPLEAEEKLKHMYAQGQVGQDEMFRALQYVGR